MSRLSFYVHDGRNPLGHVGVRIDGTPRLDGLRVVEPTRADAGRLTCRLAAVDGSLELSIDVRLGDGAIVASTFRVHNTSAQVLPGVRLSVYANLEADHSSDDDHALLDVDGNALAVVDAINGATCLLGGNRPVESGWAGTWPSQTEFSRGDGLPKNDWQRLMPPRAPTNAAEPPTVSLTPVQAQAALDADYLREVDGHSLPERIDEELRWARDVAARLRQADGRLDFSGVLAELDGLQSRRTVTTGADPLQSLYLSVRRVKRHIVFRNPLSTLSNWCSSINRIRTAANGSTRRGIATA